MTQLDRKAIRSMIRTQRLKIPEPVRQDAAERICHTMAQLQVFQQARRIAGFLAFEGEADPRELMNLAHRQQKEVYVPVIVAKGSPLQFAPWSPESPMKLNFFGIAEPDVPPSQWIAGSELELVICPLVGFDQWCNRIGVGAGYYDRTFAFLKDSNSNASAGESSPPNQIEQASLPNQLDQASEPPQAGQTNQSLPMSHAPQRSRRPILAGFAFEMQRLAQIDAQPWDVPLDWIVTEKQIYRRSG